MTPPPPPNAVAFGILSMIAAVSMIAVVDALGKWLGAGYAVSEIVFFRTLFAVPLIVGCAAATKGGIAKLKMANPWAHLLRGLAGTGAVFSFVQSLTALPLAEATALAFAAPLFVTALSVPLLKEAVGPRRWTAAIVGFVGVLVIVRPGMDAFQPAMILVLITALCYAVVMLTARAMAPRENLWSMVFSVNVVPLVIGAVMLPFQWTRPTVVDMGLFAAAGVLGVSFHALMAKAFKLAPAAVIAPFDYATLLWATLIGWLVWDEMPGPVTWTGAALIVASGLYIAYRETRSGGSA